MCSANISLAQNPNSPRFQTLKCNGKPWWVEAAFALNSQSEKNACADLVAFCYYFPSSFLWIEKVLWVVSLPPPWKRQESNRFVMLCWESIVLFPRTSEKEKYVRYYIILAFQKEQNFQKMNQNFAIYHITMWHNFDYVII